MNKFHSLYPIAVITTVYNRKKDLEKLYQSLKEQKNKNFSWIIIDDGSTESLFNLVEKWKNESSFQIFYYRHANQGKLYAYKTAVNLIDCDWSIVVDSDDTVSNNMINILYNTIPKISTNLCGALFPRDTKGVGNQLEQWNKLPCMLNIIDLHYSYNIIESAILFRHKLLTMVFDSLKLPKEKFISEEVLYNKFISKGKFLVIPVVFYYAEYKSGGMTNNLFKLWKSNFNSTILLLLSRYKAVSYLSKKRNVIVSKVKTILNVNAICLATKHNLLCYSPNKLLSILLFVPSLIILKVRFKNV